MILSNWNDRKSIIMKSNLWTVSRMLVLASLVGLVAGVGAIVFHYLSHTILYYSLGVLAGYHQTAPAGESAAHQSTEIITSLRPYMLLAIITAGGLLSGLLIYSLAPEAEGHGTDAAIAAYHRSRGIIRPIVPILKLIASAITLGTGGSGGREGPIAQIGAGFGSYLGTKLKLSENERRILLAAGMGAGIGAIFRAPLAGAIFSTEVLYSEPDFEGEALIPSFISTTVAYCVFSLVFGFGHLFSVNPISFEDPRLLLPLAGLAAVMAGASFIYVKVFYGVRNLFKRMRVTNHIKPMIGAFLTGLFGITLYMTISKLNPQAGYKVLNVLSVGYGILQDILSNSLKDMDLTTYCILLLTVGFGKILTTSLTISSGGSAGVFGPSMVIGGTLGGLVGIIMQLVFPDIVTNTDIFVILGMAGFFSAAANTPVSTLIMVTEMTASYTLLLPAMWVCAIAYLLGRGWSIYSEQVPTKLDSPAHRGDFIVDILQDLKVKDALRPERTIHIIPQNKLLKDLIPIIVDSTQSCYPVSDEKGRYTGAFSINDIRRFLYENEFQTLATAEDLITTTTALYPETDLSTAMKTFTTSKFDELPVIDEKTNTIIGIIRYQDIVAAYNAYLLEVRGDLTGQ